MFVMQSNLKLSFGLVIVIVRQHQLRKRIRGFELPKLKARETVTFATLSSRCCYIPVLALLLFFCPVAIAVTEAVSRSWGPILQKPLCRLHWCQKFPGACYFLKWNDYCHNCLLIRFLAFIILLWSQGFRHWLAFFVFGLLWPLIFECVWCMKEAGEPCTLSWHTTRILKLFQYFWRACTRHEQKLHNVHFLMLELGVYMFALVFLL